MVIEPTDSVCECGAQIWLPREATPHYDGCRVDRFEATGRSRQQIRSDKWYRLVLAILDYLNR